MSSKISADGDQQFFCLIDTYLAVKDYARGGRCVRFIGVQRGEFQTLSDTNELGVATFILDVDFWEYCEHEANVSNWRAAAHEGRKIESKENSLDGDPIWYRLDVEIVQKASGYLYRTFSESVPLSFRLKQITRVPGPGKQKLIPNNSFLALLSNQSGKFIFNLKPSSRRIDVHAFHVGQGMCSLIHDGQRGILLDAGAGKPVTRKRYLSGALINELRKVADSLSVLEMVVSHADYDHWKLLAWDRALLDKVETVFVPAGVSHLVFRDEAVIDKCVSAVAITFKFWKGCSLQVTRSQPSTSDRNGECLVGVFNRHGEKVLLPGDYVYSRFLTDHAPEIRALHGNRYRAVLVPHHGDAASANNIVRCSGKQSIAFFSAGTHQGYKHPTEKSLGAHSVARYKNIWDKNQDNIIGVRLL